MTSQELRNAKAQLLTNINNYINQCNNLCTKMNTVNNCFSNSTDTIINNEMLESGTKITEKLNDTINEINAKKNAAIQLIDAEIQRLEIYERQQLEKQKEKQQEGE